MSSIRFTAEDRARIVAIRAYLMARYGDGRPPTISRAVRWALRKAVRVAERRGQQ